jgi:hypothetical protein
MNAEHVKCRRDYVLPGLVGGVPADEVVRVIRRVDVGVAAAGWVLVRGDDGKRFMSHASHMRAVEQVGRGGDAR